MRYRRVGQTSIEVSEIGFGAWTVGTSWWGEVGENAAVKLLQRAYELGINFFDTADTYGEGLSERLLAKALKRERERIVIATKFGYDFYRHRERQGHSERPQNFSPDYIRFALEQSLRRLETEWVDIYQLHNPRLETLKRDEVFDTLEELRREGKIRHYGVALGPAIGWLEEGAFAIRERRVATVQTVYNILEQEPTRQLFPLARRFDSSILVRVPHASGALEEGFTGEGRFGPGDHRSFRYHESPNWFAEALRKVEKLRFLLREGRRSISRVALKFVLAESSVASVLPTVTSLPALENYARASEEGDLTAEELERIHDLYEHNFYLGAPTEAQAPRR